MTESIENIRTEIISSNSKIVNTLNEVKCSNLMIAEALEKLNTFLDTKMK